MRFVLDGKVYDADAVSNLSLADAMQYDREARANGWPSWAEVEQAMDEAAVLPREEAGRHPGVLMWLALATWRARREAGERLTYAEAIDTLPIRDPSRFRILADPEPPQEDPDPPTPRSGSGRGASKARAGR